MSTSDVNEPLSNWGGVNTDVLLCIFRKLDMVSLFNCMLVNRHWGTEAKYHCNHDNKWDKVVDGATNWRTSGFRDKSNLDDRGIVKSAWFWHNVKSATLSFHHRYEIKRLGGISIYKDNLIAASTKGVEYYNIHNFQLLKTVETKCIKHYIETSSLIVKHNYMKVNTLTDNIFTLINKLHFSQCDCIKPLKNVIYNVVYWRVDSDCCYIWDKEHVLHRYTADKCKWNVDILAYYECSPDFICGLNIHHESTFLFTKDNKYPYRNFFRSCAKQIYKYTIVVPYSITPRMFNTFSVLCAVASEKQLHINVESVGEQIMVTCPGLSSATEHGHMLILGYRDGKVQIFRRADLSKKIMIPELQFYLREHARSRSYKIIAIDVYETKNCHHLFVATEYNIYEFHILDNDTEFSETIDTSSECSETTDTAYSETTNTDNNEIFYTTDTDNTKTTDTASTETTATASTETTTTASTETTTTASTKTTATASTETTATASTETSATASTETTATASTETTATASTETTVTASTEITATASTETTPTASTETSATASTETSATASTETTAIASTETTATASTETTATASTETTATASTETTATASTETSATASTETTATASTETTATASTETTVTASTEITATASTETTPTASTETTATASTETSATASTETTAIASTETTATASTETTATASTETTATASTETSATASTETSATASTETTATASTETTATASTETSATASTETTATASTETSATASTETTATASTETSATASTETTATASTETTATASTETSATASTETTATASTETSATASTETTTTAGTATTEIAGTADI